MSWTISVCLTCGREAKWPFCEHRRTDGEPWSTYVRTVASAADSRWLRAEMAQRQASGDGL